MGNNLDEVKAARDAVIARRLIVQVGTQRRSEPYQIAAKAWHATGVIGEMSKIEIVWNYHGPRWRGRPEVAQIREADTDWRRWLMTRPYRPFDPRLYFEYRLYSEFSSGIPDQWMSHGIDLAHWFMDDHFPTSVVANGGVFAWKDGRENPDTFQALLTYPKGVMVSYSTSFGNDAESTIRLMGKTGTMINYGTEGTPRWKWVEERGNYEDTPDLVREEKWLSTTGRRRARSKQHARRGSVTHDQLARGTTRRPSAVGAGGSGICALGCMHHGGAGLPREARSLLGSTQRSHPGSSAGRRLIAGKCRTCDARS